MHDVEHTEERAYPMLNSLLSALGNDVGIAAITATDGATFRNFSQRVGMNVPFYYSDKTLLKTMIRSNPGLVLMQDGVIIEKWHYNDIPGATELLQALRP